MKEIDLKKSVYELTKTYPELIDILKELGFLGAGESSGQKNRRQGDHITPGL